MFLSCNNNTTGALCGAGTANPSGRPGFTPVLLLAIDFSVIHRFTASDYPFGIVTPFLSEAV